MPVNLPSFHHISIALSSVSRTVPVHVQPWAFPVDSPCSTVIVWVPLTRSTTVEVASVDAPLLSGELLSGWPPQLISDRATTSEGISRPKPALTLAASTQP